MMLSLLRYLSTVESMSVELLMKRKCVYLVSVAIWCPFKLSNPSVGEFPSLMESVGS